MDITESYYDRFADCSHDELESLIAGILDQLNRRFGYISIPLATQFTTMIANSARNQKRSLDLQHAILKD